MEQTLTYTDALEDLRLTAEGVTRARSHGKGVQEFRMVDPLADQFPSYTPYNYTMNNPISMTDPTGMAPEVCCPDGGDGDWDDMKADLNEMTGSFSLGDELEALAGAVQAGAEAVGSALSAVIPDEGSSTDPSGSRDAGTIEGSGVEMMNPEGDWSPRAAGNGPSTPEANGGSKSIVDYGKGDAPSGGGGTKSGGKHQQPSKIVKSGSKAKTAVKKYQRATKTSSSVQDTSRPYHTVRQLGRTPRIGEIDTVRHD